MKKCMVLLVLAGVVMAGGLRAENAVFYVSTIGSDSWTGKLAEPDKAKTDGPFATVNQARDAIRELKGDEGLKFPVSVQIRGGIYYLEDALVFSPKDSGSKDFPVTYQAYKNEKPILSGGRLIKGWKKNTGGLSTVDSGLWTTEIPETMTENWYFNQLFVNGERRTRARAPGKGEYFRVRYPVPGQAAFYYKKGDAKKFENFEDVMMTLFHNWESSIHYLASIDTDNLILKIKPGPPWAIGNQGGKNPRYVIENAFELLDEPGEWYLNKKTGVLYYYPVPGEDMAKAEVIAPFLKKTVMNLKGKPEQGQFIEYINFKGISFRHADAYLPRSVPNSGQAAFNQEAAIMAKGARNCRFEDCEIAHVGEYGIWLRQGSQDNTITRCVVRDMGAGGIRIGEGASPPNETSAVQRNLVDNNLVYDGGYIFHGGVGIFIVRSSYNTVTHNEICDLDYTGISVGWSWGYAPTSAHDNIVEYNHIHHLMNGVMSDGAGIYTLGISPGTRLRYQVIHDVYSYSYGGWGLYNDEGSTNILLENNLVYNTKSGGYHQHYGRENINRNNIYAYALEGQIIRSREEEHISFNFENNIVYCRNATPLGGNWGNDNYVIDNNLYWNENKEEMVFAGTDLKGWQEDGKDRHSIIADPMFVDAKNYDFRLKPGSPAEKIGFKPFDTSKAGLYGEKEWVDAPKKLTHRAVEPFEGAATSVAGSVSDDFEMTPPGLPPDYGVANTEEKSSIMVSKDTAATGSHSLKFTDAPGQKQIWNPHLFYNVDAKKGKMRFSCDIKNSIENPADIWMEMRQWNVNPYLVGPVFWFHPDGSFEAAGQKGLGTVPAGEWFNVEVIFEMGGKAPKTYKITLNVPGKKPQVFKDLEYASKDFTELTWAGIVSMTDAKSFFYIDNVKLEPIK